MNLTKSQLNLFAAFVFDAEKELDANGKVKVAILPPSDGGGAYEVAGINQRFDGSVCAKLKAMVEAGNFAGVRTMAMAYYITDTQDAAGWTDDPVLEAYLRDCIFNRGEAGTVEIMQMAVNRFFHGTLTVDGGFGPKSRAAFVDFYHGTSPLLVLAALRTAREDYELKVAPPVGARGEMWAGLVNRWNNAFTMALQFIPVTAET